MSAHQHIILDVDNTLLYTSNTKFISPDKKEKPDFTIDLGGKPGYVYLRPYLFEFFDYCFQNFGTVNIWTLGNSYYFQTILKELKKKYKKKLHFHIVYTYEDSPKKFYDDIDGFMNIKDLNKIWGNPLYSSTGINKNNTIFIDDRADVLRETPGNHIEVGKYIGQRKDDTLLKLMMFLNRIKDKKMIPRVKKVDWYDKTQITEKTKNAVLPPPPPIEKKNAIPKKSPKKIKKDIEKIIISLKN